MPLYEFRCSSCEHLEEVLQKYNDPPPATCPECGKAGTMAKEVSLTSFQLKGGGWYKDLYSSTPKDGGKDSGKDAGKDSGKKDKAAASGSSSSSSGDKSGGSSGGSGGSSGGSGGGSGGSGGSGSKAAAA